MAKKKDAGASTPAVKLLTGAGVPFTVHTFEAEDRSRASSAPRVSFGSEAAGALGVRLGGRNIYFGRSETRPFLGDGPRPSAVHLRRAARVSGAVGVVALGLAAGMAAVRGAVRR